MSGHVCPATKKIKPVYIYTKTAKTLKVAALRFYDRAPGSIVQAYIADVKGLTPKQRVWTFATEGIIPLDECEDPNLWFRAPLVIASADLYPDQAKNIMDMLEYTPAVMSLAAQEQARTEFDDWRDAHPEFDACTHVVPVSADDARSYVTRLGASSITASGAPHVHFGGVPRVSKMPFNKAASVKAVSNTAPFQLALVRESAIAGVKRRYPDAPRTLTNVFPPASTWLDTCTVMLDADTVGQWARAKHPKHKAIFHQLAYSHASCFLPIAQVFPDSLIWVSAYPKVRETLHARAARSRGILKTADIDAFIRCLDTVLEMRLLPVTTSLADFICTGVNAHTTVYVNPAVIRRATNITTSKDVLLRTPWDDFALLHYAFAAYFQDM